MPTISTTELRRIICLQDLPEAHLQWILDRAEYVEYPDGAVITKTGDPIDELWLTMEGKALFYNDINGNLVHFAAFNNHIGFYATPTGHDKFKTELSKYKQGKGSVQFPIGEPMPLKLIEKIVKFRVKNVVSSQ